MLVGLFPVVEVVASEKGSSCCLLQQSSVLVVSRRGSQNRLQDACFPILIWGVYLQCELFC